MTDDPTSAAKGPRTATRAPAPAPRDPSIPIPADSSRRSLPGLSSMPTSMIELSSGFIDRLKLVAPKKTRSKVWYVVIALVVGFGAIMAVSSTARGKVVAQGRALIAKIKRQPQAPPAVSAPVEVASSVAALPEPAPSAIPSVAPSASASAAPAPSASIAPSASASGKKKPWVRRR